MITAMFIFALIVLFTLSTAVICLTLDEAGYEVATAGGIAIISFVISLVTLCVLVIVQFGTSI